MSALDWGHRSLTTTMTTSSFWMRSMKSPTCTSSKKELWASATTLWRKVYLRSNTSWESNAKPTPIFVITMFAATRNPSSSTWQSKMSSVFHCPRSSSSKTSSLSIHWLRLRSEMVPKRDTCPTFAKSSWRKDKRTSWRLTAKVPSSKSPLLRGTSSMIKRAGVW